MLNTDKIQKLKDEIAALEASDAAFLSLPLEQQIATSLHKVLCHHNHVDGCSWEYETGWVGYARERYLGKAKRVIAFCDKHGIHHDHALGFLTELYY